MNETLRLSDSSEMILSDEAVLGREKGRGLQPYKCPTWFCGTLRFTPPSLSSTLLVGL